MPLSITVNPQRLEEVCLTYSSKLILDGCKWCPNGESKLIQHLASTISGPLANRYMSEVLSMSAHQKRYQEVNIRDAFCPWCTRISVSTLEEETNLLDNLDRLRHLTHLWLEWSDSSKDHPEIACLVAKHIPELLKLKSLRIASVVTDEAGLFEKLVEYCPDLEELSIKWRLSRNQQVTLARCGNLKSVFVEYRGGDVDDVKYILDSIPQLEVLRIPRRLVSLLLLSVRKSYPLRRLSICDGQVGSFPVITGSTLLRCLARHFLRLHEGRFHRCADLTPLNRFGEMRILHISCTREQMSGVDGAVFARLVRLTLSRLPGLSSALKSVKDISMPNLLDLNLFHCKEVSLLQLSILCPQLQEMRLCNCRVTPINPEETLQPFTKLQKLYIYDIWNRLIWDHIMIIMSHCKDLEVLEVCQDSLDNSVVHKLLECNPMPRMRRFTFTSNRLTPEIATVVFKYFGDSLVDASFKGALMRDVSMRLLQDLWRRMQPYCLSLTLGSFNMTTGQTN